MNFKYLNYILAIAKYKNISKAAKELYISQPTLSLYLSNLEKELGTPLFIHSKKEMTLTYAGHLYVEAAQKILDIRDQLYNDIKNLTLKEATSLSVGIMPLTGSSMFSTVFPKFKELYPDSSLQITEDLSRMLERLLSEKKINLAVISTDQSRNPDFHYDIIKKEEFVMVISPKHPGFSRLPSCDEPIDLTLLKDFSFILTPNPTVRRSIENNIFSNYNFEPEIMCEINNITTIYQMISKNNGIAFIPEGYINTDSSNCYFRLTQHPHWELAVIYHKDYHPNNAEKEFITMVTDYYRFCTSYLSN